MITSHASMHTVQAAAILLDWEARGCTNQACTGDRWVVKRAPVLTQLWWVAPQPNQALVLVAGSEPLCPHCGSLLAAMPEPPREVSPVAIRRMRRRR